MNSTTIATGAPRSLTLTLSQALRRVAELKGEIKEHTSRASGNVCFVQEQEPVFRFEEEIMLRAQALEEMIRLEAAIAEANAVTKIEFEGRKMAIAEAVRRLQEFKGEIAFYASLQIREGKTSHREPEFDEHERRVMRTVETVYVSLLSERSRVAKVAELRKRFSALNGLVESANHRTELLVELPPEVVPET